MAKSKKVNFDTLAVENVCLSMLRQGRIPTIRGVRTAGAEGDNATLAKAVRKFKVRYAPEIKKLRVERVMVSNDASQERVLSIALQHFEIRTEIAERALEELKRNSQI